MAEAILVSLPFTVIPEMEEQKHGYVCWGDVRPTAVVNRNLFVVPLGERITRRVS